MERQNFKENMKISILTGRQVHHKNENLLIPHIGALLSWTKFYVRMGGGVRLE